MKVAIAGYGVMGHHHARVLRDQGFDVVTVDPAGHADCTDLRQADCHAVVIATPADQLHATALLAHELDMEVMLVEKPGATNLRCLSHLQAAHPKAAVGYIERHNPALEAMNANLYRVGTVLNVKATRTGQASRHTVDPALDLATHDLDALAYLDIRVKPAAFTNDGATLNVLFDRGTLTASHAHPTKRRTLHVLGTEGELVCDYQAQTLTFLYPGGEQDLSPTRSEPLVRMWEAILEGKPHATTIDAYPTLRTALSLLCPTPEPVSTAASSCHTSEAHAVTSASTPDPLEHVPPTTTPPPTTEAKTGRH